MAELKIIETGKDMKYAFQTRPVSWGTAKRLAVNALRLEKARAENDPVAMAEAFEIFQTEVAKVVVSVPPEALIEGAPKNLDWSKPDSYDWLLQDAMTELSGYMSGEKSAKSAKN